MNLQDFSGKCDRCLHRIIDPRRRVDPIKSRTRANQLMMPGRTEEYARRVRQRRRGGGQTLQGGAEAIALLEIERMVAQIGAGEMAHPDQWPQAGHGGFVAGQSVDGRRIQTKAVHAGVDMHDRIERLAGLLRQGTPGIDLRAVVQRWQDVVSDELALEAGQQSVQRHDWQIDDRAAQGNRFFEMGDEEPAAAFGLQATGDFGGAEPVAVGLDHGGARRRLRAPGEQAPVGGDGVEIDGQRAGGSCPHRAAVSCRRRRHRLRGSRSAWSGRRTSTSPCRSGHGAAWRR